MYVLAGSSSSVTWYEVAAVKHDKLIKLEAKFYVAGQTSYSEKFGHN